MLICKRCGQENDPDAAFCANRSCGAVLEWEGEKVEPDPTDEVPPVTAVKPDRTAPVRQRQRTIAVAATVSPPTLDVDPGDEAHCQVRVRNEGSIVDQFAVEVVGAAAAWTTCEPSTLNVFPDSEEVATVRFAPPRGPVPAAGTEPFQVRVTSRQDPTVSAVDGGVVTVTPFTDLVGSLDPPTDRSRGAATYTFTVHNRGNAPDRVAFDVQDPDRQLECAVDPPSGVCQPGSSLPAALAVHARQRHWLGRPKRHTFTAIATRQDAPASAPPIQQQGTFQQLPVIAVWLALLVVGVVALGIVLWLLLRGDFVEMPDLLNQQEEVARQILENRGLTPSVVRVESDQAAPGTVIAQAIDPGERVERGSAVEFTVAERALLDVPNVVGMPREEAEALLLQGGFELGPPVFEESDEPDGTVVGQTPRAGTREPAGTEVVLAIATTDVRSVPNLSGQSESAAQQTLIDAGLVLGAVQRLFSDQEANTVIGQQPGPGTELESGSSVSVTVARARTVPDLVGGTLAQAEAALQARGLDVGEITWVDTTNPDEPSGLVLVQHVEEDTVMTQGQTVDLDVAAFVVSQGGSHLTSEGEFNLDAGSSEEPPFDLAWDSSQEEIVAVGDARFAVLGDDVDFDALPLGDLLDLTYDATVVDAEPDMVFAVRTSDGNVAKVRLNFETTVITFGGEHQNAWQFSWVTYAPPS